MERERKEKVWQVLNAEVVQFNNKSSVGLIEKCVLTDALSLPLFYFFLPFSQSFSLTTAASYLSDLTHDEGRERKKEREGMKIDEAEV